jgi:hypothetical protein
MELVELPNGDPSLLDIEGIEGVTGNDECRRSSESLKDLIVDVNKSLRMVSE